jgi:hypothetical protein
MIGRHILIAISVFVFTQVLSVATAFSHESDNTSVPVGPYLGQTSPGSTPELFAPEIIPLNRIMHSSPTFSPDGNYMFWSVIFREERRAQIMYMKAVSDGWTLPAVAPFSGIDSDANPCFSPDGNRLYFASSRSGGSGRGDIWYVTRTDQGWSDPVNLGSPPNGSGSEGQPCVTADGSLFFISAMDSVEWNRGIYQCRKEGNTFMERVALPSVINTSDADAYPFIAPDQSYLLFCSGRPGCNSVETDMYVSFRKLDGEWGVPVQMGPEINNGNTVSFPRVTSDGKYLFFRRFSDGNDPFFWVETSVLGNLRPSE